MMAILHHDIFRIFRWSICMNSHGSWFLHLPSRSSRPGPDGFGFLREKVSTLLGQWYKVYLSRTYILM